MRKKYSESDSDTNIPSFEAITNIIKSFPGKNQNM